MKDIVTEIRELRNGVRVTVNDQRVLCMTRKDYRAFPLKEGDAVDFEELEHDLLLQQYPDALNRAVRLLAVRARSCREVEKRLTDACYSEAAVEMALTKLESLELLDDDAFARQWARERTARQIGKNRILYELRQKGINADLAELAIAELTSEQQENGAAVLAAKLQKRYQNLPEEAARHKIIPAMQRRGYTYGEILTSLNWKKKDKKKDSES